MNRQNFLNCLEKLARPLLEAGGNGLLKEKMVIEEKPETGRDRQRFSYWEGVGRLLCGLAPWFECTVTNEEEKALQKELLALSHQMLAYQVDPASLDYTPFDEISFDYSQIIVDTAFLAQAFLRSPKNLYGGLDATTKKRLTVLFKQIATLKAYPSNWFLFTSEIEAALVLFGEEYNPANVQLAYSSFEAWYVGDGWYADGSRFALDYYNSLVIHPMLLDLVKVFPHELPKNHDEVYLARAKRQAQHLERMITPSGAYYATGRSLAYRCGVFHLLAQLALEEHLPASISWGMARNALGLAIKATLSPTSYRKDGFLTIGLCGAQPGFGETYISTGSLYLCSTAFLPLGLPETHEFWSSPLAPLTFERAWNGEDLPADEKIK